MTSCKYKARSQNSHSVCKTAHLRSQDYPCGNKIFSWLKYRCHDLTTCSPSWRPVLNKSVLLYKCRIMMSSRTQQEALLSGQTRMPLPTFPLTVNWKPFVLGSLDILGAAQRHSCQTDLGTDSITIQDLKQPYDMLMQHCQPSVRLQCFLFICCIVGDVKVTCFSVACASELNISRIWRWL